MYGEKVETVGVPLGSTPYSVRKPVESFKGSVIVRLPQKEATQFVFYKAMLLYMRGESFLGKETQIRGQGTTQTWLWSLSCKDLLLLGRRATMTFLKDDFQVSEIKEAFARLVKINKSMYSCESFRDLYDMKGFDGVKKVINEALRQLMVELIGENVIEEKHKEETL